MNDLELSTGREEKVAEEEFDHGDPTPSPTGIGVYERPERKITSTVVIGLVVFFLLLITAAVILFVI